MLIVCVWECTKLERILIPLLCSCTINTRTHRGRWCSLIYCTSKVVNFCRYMKRRCEFLDNCPAFIYNPGSSEYIDTPQGPRRNDTKQLGSTLMRAMLNEVSDFCDPIIRENWALKPHHQVGLCSYLCNC